MTSSYLSIQPQTLLTPSGGVLCCKQRLGTAFCAGRPCVPDSFLNMQMQSPTQNHCNVTDSMDGGTIRLSNVQPTSYPQPWQTTTTLRATLRCTPSPRSKQAAGHASSGFILQITRLSSHSIQPPQTTLTLSLHTRTQNSPCGRTNVSPC